MAEIVNDDVSEKLEAIRTTASLTFIWFATNVKFTDVVRGVASKSIADAPAMTTSMALTVAAPSAVTLNVRRALMVSVHQTWFGHPGDIAHDVVPRPALALGSGGET